MQDGTITFITMRLADSIPEEVILRWERERLEYLRSRGIESADWRDGRLELTGTERSKFDRHFHRLREDELDTCRGACQLRDVTAAETVADSLLHFDEDRYLMGDFIVMPNHVHLLAVFPTGDLMRKQCYSWMKYTATLINRFNGDRGTLWQEEPFDHLVRSEEQLTYLRNYIAQNPTKAGLKPGEYHYRQSTHPF
ncbi:MAG: hypothetical protein KDB00_08070 [Planctomycetales bacterium]|nr:hypothetical protein [Planctomycetales bacterium]